MAEPFRFDPVDIELMLVRGRLTPGQRLQALLDARELLVGLMRARLRQRYPDMSPRELNLHLLAEIDRAPEINA